MTTAWMSEPVNGESDAVLLREGRTRIAILTRNPLTDEQVKELYYVALFMQASGKTLREALNWESRT